MVLALLLPLFALGLFAVAQPAPQKTIDAMTAYLDRPIGRAYRLYVKGALGGEGVVSVDPNMGTLDTFGEPKVHTELVIVPVRVTLRFAPELDKKDGSRCYDVVGRGLPPLRLIVAPAGRPARLVVLDAKGQAVRVVTLEPAP